MNLRGNRSGIEFSGIKLIAGSSGRQVAALGCWFLFRFFSHKDISLKVLLGGLQHESEYKSYCNAPYPRERRSYGYLIERSNLCFQHAQFVLVFSRSYGTRKATWEEFLQPSLVLVYELQ
ncbi:hypothetical protein C1H46_029291 [Malus baccata]|uniref:Uncharacterized protein n=1 Tax=Malus baccata TaxID=106549 RepID=A0A540LFF1_MALBA|nr:hypothetical protein C1H46_029291 [Malus baccata]